MTLDLDNRTRIRRFLAENFLFGVESDLADDDASLVQSGVIDSTGILELVAFVEEAFGLSVDEDEIVPENFDSVRQIVAFVERKK